MARQQQRDRGAKRKNRMSGGKKNTHRKRRYQLNPQHPGSKSFIERMAAQRKAA